MSTYAVTNPSTGIVEATYDTATDIQVSKSVELAEEGFRTWSRSFIHERVELLNHVADLYEQRRDELASIITREMGKPAFQAGIEIDIVVSIYRYYASNGPTFLKEEQIDVAAGGTAVVHKQALGPLLGIMPWNFPYYQVARFAAPNLMNGNTIVLKHAPQCPESAMAIENIFRDAGAPKGAYVNVFATNDQIAQVIADPRIQGVSLTGSERAGSAVAEIAGRNIKKVVLELGGSDPFIVLADANIEAAVRQAVFARFGNTGQACNAAKRFIIDESVYAEFAQGFADAVKNIAVGDPTQPDTFMGPLSSMSARASLAEQVRDAIDKGATVVVGGSEVPGAGAFFEPTILADVTPEMRVYTEELFGPVAVLYKVSGDDEAVDLANSSVYGLGASVQSQDPQRAQSVAVRLESGMVSINEPSGTAAELPFGGVKRSGVGRELGPYGMAEFVNHKLIKSS